MNLSIHLPNDILGDLDAHVRATANSRSAVVREAVVQYLELFRSARWPDELLAHMQAGVAKGDANPDESDFDAVRAEMNASMHTRVQATAFE